MRPSKPASVPRAARRPGGWEVIVLSAWFGLVAGLLEVLTKVVCTAIGRSAGSTR